MSIFSLDGELLSRWGTDDCLSLGSFYPPHALFVDSKGSIYVEEVIITSPEKGKAPGNGHSLQKFTPKP